MSWLKGSSTVSRDFARGALQRGFDHESYKKQIYVWTPVKILYEDPTSYPDFIVADIAVQVQVINQVMMGTLILAV